MLAAASFLAEVVKVLERVTFQAAEAANAEPDEDMVRQRCCFEQSHLVDVRLGQGMCS